MIFQGSLAAEFEGLGEAKTALAVSPAEAALLRKAGQTRVSVLGTARAPDPTPAGFAARDGLLFVGAIHQPGSAERGFAAVLRGAYLPALARLVQAPPSAGCGGASGGGDRSFARLAGGLRLLGEVGDRDAAL